MPRIEFDTAIAELERYGLSVRVINALERRCGVVWVRDLRAFSVDELAVRMKSPGLRLGELYEALRNYEAGCVVKRVDECMGDCDMRGMGRRRRLIRSGRLLGDV